MPFNVYETRVRSHQTDLNAAMYHGAYLDVFDDARIEAFRTAGYDYARAVEGGWTPVIRHVECEYFFPARMDDPIAITVTVPKLTVAKMTIRYDCHGRGRLLASAQVVFVFLDRKGKLLRVPEDLRKVVAEHPEFRVAG
jgi:acyl-CoA thioester hydrolase